jgi:phosphoribosylamine--glycine ligase
MRILVLGGGGREHALVWKLRQCPQVGRVYCAPGSAGMGDDAEILPDHSAITDPKATADLAAHLGVDLTVVGPEAPLVAGVADEFRRRGLLIAGPSRAAAQLEGSKIFAKRFMRRMCIPTAEFAVIESVADTPAILGRFGFPVVIKADGLAAGKGVVVAKDREEAAQAASAMLAGELAGDAGRRIVIEQFLPGEEVSFMVLAAGADYLPLAPTQDHKAVFDNDEGPNTGGMGAYCDDSIVSEQLRARILREVVEPTLAGMVAEGSPFHGVLYCGLMISGGEARVLEYNVRLGDPETQPLMVRLESGLDAALFAAARDDGSLARTRLSWKPGASVCVVAASRGYPGAFERGFPITGLEAANSLPGVKVFHAGTRRSEGALVTSGGRVLGITAHGSNLGEAVAQAYCAVDLIHFEGMHCRRDIGRKGLARGGAL